MLPLHAPGGPPHRPPPRRAKWAELTVGDGGPRSVVKFTNCKLYSPHRAALVADDLWVRNGAVIDPASRFWEANTFSEFACDLIVDCGGLILSPGFIDVQINGAFGVDFSDPRALTVEAVEAVCTALLPSGVTALCPTLVSSAPDTYAACVAVFERVKRAREAKHAAAVAALASERAAARGGGSGGGGASGSTTPAESPPAVGAVVVVNGGRGAAATDASGGEAAEKLQRSEWRKRYVGGARVMGLHLEGPFINVERKGAHMETNLREVSGVGRGSGKLFIHFTLEQGRAAEIAVSSL